MTTQHTTLLLSTVGLFAAATVYGADGDTWKVSQTDFGGTGLMQVPTARMAEEGEFNIGVNINDDYHHYMVSLQLMSWLETTIRYSRLPDFLYSNKPEFSNDNIYTDKGIDFKLRLIEEGYWLPETSFGIRDFGGTGLFDGEYLAATKRFGSVDFTLGLGWGYLGQSGTVSNPFCKASDKFCTRPSDYKGEGGSVDFERWFKGPAAIFGGIEYQTPYQPLRIKLEYEGNDYSKDLPTVQGKPLIQHTPWNIGINYRLGDWGDAKLSYQRGDTLTFGLNLYTNFDKMYATWRDTPKPETIIRPSEQSTNWTNVTKELKENAGYKHVAASVEGDTVIVSGEQSKYRDRNEALDRAAAILNNNTKSDINTFKVIETNNGISLTETEIDRETYVAAANYLETELKTDDAYSRSEPKTSHSSIQADTKERWEYGLEPVLKQSLGAPEAFYLYNLGINATSSFWFADNIELGGSVYFNIVDNYDKFNFLQDAANKDTFTVPRVRTMFRSYVQDNPIRLNHLQLTWFEQPFESVYTQAYGGYLESMFAGVGTEILYRPMNTNWAVGIDANLVSQREPDSWFGLFSDDYYYYDGHNPNAQSCINSPWTCQSHVLSKGTTGHITGYYMPKWDFLANTLFKVSAGKFLAGDMGGRVDFAKQFKSGVIVGAYATMTDLTPEQYGEGSYNKGFYISIPMDIMTIKPSTSRTQIGWQPITRDGGQMLRKQYYLFSITDARSQWYQRPNTAK